jgi:hypothetical protein
MATVQILTPQGHLNTEGEIVGPLCVADLSPFIERGQEMYGVAHLKTGYGIAAFRSEEVAQAFAGHIAETDWDSIFERVGQGVKMDDMAELPELLDVFWRSLHDSHSIIPLACAWYTPQAIVDWVDNHRDAIQGAAN